MTAEGRAAGVAASPQAKDVEARMAAIVYSVIIPVYRSEAFLAHTVERTVSFFDSKGWSYEIVLVNDGSPDGSWGVIEELCAANPRIVGIDLLKNSGQHNANFVGLAHMSGDVAVTMDDDLQNPPEEIATLARKYVEGHDLVVGALMAKKHGTGRSLGSAFVRAMNQRIFPAPPGFRHSNFRMLDKAVVRRMLSYRTHAPYTSGLAVRMAKNPANAPVRHDQRVAGESNYSLPKLASLLWQIVFNYSLIPLRLTVAMGLVLSALLALASVFYVIRALLGGTSVSGWTTIIVLVSISNAMLFLFLSILGEYVGKTMQLVSLDRSAFVVRIVRAGEDE